MKRLVLTLGVMTTVVASADRLSLAESWCATPVVAHEWGVHLFDPSGVPRPPPTALLPAAFHRRAPATAATAARVVDLPPDSGIRLLPLLHFYAPGNYHSDIPLGLGVGFTSGAATAWFPQVDVWRSDVESNQPAAQTLRNALAAARAQLSPMGARPTLPDDPTRQLQWNQLTLGKAPKHAVASPTESWVTAARQIADALWVEHGDESERFVFYEGATRENVAVRIRRAPGATGASRQYVVENTLNEPIYDLVIAERDGATRLAGLVPKLGPGASATVPLLPTTVPKLVASLRAHWLVNGTATGRDGQDGKTGCAMMRDPAIPFEKASGHQLYGPELDLLFAAWTETMFGGTGLTIVYREDTATLDRAMPLSLFTDMWHFVELHRLGLAIQQNVALP